MVDNILDVVVVRRQWNDWRTARYRIGDLDGLHMSDISGGINARAPRDFMHGYVSCDGMIDGELSHSCRHGEGPHRIKVCVVQKDNPKAVYKSLKQRLNA